MWAKRGFALFCGIVLPVGASAFGATVDLRLDSVNPGIVESNVSFNGGATSGDAGTGSYNFTVINNPDPIVSSQIITGPTLVAFCMEGTQPAQFHVTATYTVQGPGPAIPNVSLLTAFFNQYYSTMTALNTAAASAAFQLDVWELLYDGLSNSAGSSWFSTGTFRATPGAAEDTLAESWLNGLNTSTTGNLFLYQLSNPDTQDFVFGVASNGAIPTPDTPLPAALPGGAVLIAALGAVGGFKKFRRRGA